jgi:hypothetical protein
LLLFSLALKSAKQLKFSFHGFFKSLVAIHVSFLEDISKMDINDLTIAVSEPHALLPFYFAISNLLSTGKGSSQLHYNCIKNKTILA